MSFAAGFADTEFVLDPSGALYWPAHQLLVVADLHFEKGSFFAATAYRPLPSYDTTQSLMVLARLIEFYQARQLICLGDSFHDRRAAERLSVIDTTLLRQLMAQVHWIWVTGNHDPVVPTEIGGICAEKIVIGDIAFQHDPTERQGVDDRPMPVIFGHFHPMALVSLGGRQVRRRCFVLGRNRLLLPAFGTFTGGLNVLHPAILDHFADGFRVMVLNRDKLHDINTAHLRPEASMAMLHRLPRE